MLSLFKMGTLLWNDKITELFGIPTLSLWNSSSCYEVRDDWQDIWKFHSDFSPHPAVGVGGCGGNLPTLLSFLEPKKFPALVSPSETLITTQRQRHIYWHTLAAHRKIKGTQSLMDADLHMISSLEHHQVISTGHFLVRVTWRRCGRGQPPSLPPLRPPQALTWD